MKLPQSRAAYSALRVEEEQDPFENFFHSFFGGQPVASVMKTDLYQVDGSSHMDVDLPGFDKSEIKLAYDDGTLTVSAQHAEKSEPNGYVRRERVGACSRSFYVGKIDPEKISATFTNGTLHVDLPAVEDKDKRTQIPIK